MSEAYRLPHDNNQLDSRPLGRFLLGLDGYQGKRDMYDYASKFAADNRDILNPRWRAAKVSDEQIKGRQVELEFAVGTASPKSYDWRIHVAGDPFTTEYLANGPRIFREQYNVHCSEDDDSNAVYYELNGQGSVLRKQKIGSIAVLNTLQGIIEHMTDTRDFHKNASSIRGDITRTHINIHELESKKTTLNHSETKSLAGSKSHLFLAGFSVGSIDISNKQPLL